MTAAERKPAPGQIWRGNETGRLIRLQERMNDGWACDVDDPRWLPATMWRGGEWISDWQLTHCSFERLAESVAPKEDSS